MAAIQQQLQALTDDYNTLQTGIPHQSICSTSPPLACQPVPNIPPELQNIIAARQRLESQQQENRGVKKEFDALSEEANIYKQVGPVLLKQDKQEAVMAVNGRLEFIGDEM